MRRCVLLPALALLAGVTSAAPAAPAQDTTAAGAAPARTAPARTVLAIGAHAGDMELTTGALLLKARQQGARVVLLHLTLGEGGNPRLSPEAYGEQKRREATRVAEALGAEVMFGPWRDGELPDDEAARRWVADAIRQVKPTLVVTHWSESIHKDHAAAHAIVKDAVLLATLAGVRTAHPPHRGTALWFAENWEDAEGFRPYLYVDVTGLVPAWRDAVSRYEFVGGDISAFRYLDYYTALATLRGAEARRGQAVAFEIDPTGKRRVLDGVP
ncbi:MAG TPA: PIG-L family deacetylase [Gemmatimonadales bacterium]